MSKSTFLRLALAVSMPALAAAALSSPALANVRNVSPGSSCQFATEDARHGHHIDSNGDVQFQAPIYAGIYHTYAGRLLITCPVNRNLPLTTSGLSDLEVRFTSLFTLDEEPAGKRDFRCIAYSMRTDGSFVNLQIKLASIKANPPANTPNPGPNETATLDFGNTINQSVSKGAYNVFCDFPGEIELTSVYVSELEE